MNVIKITPKSFRLHPSFDEATKFRSIEKQLENLNKDFEVMNHLKTISVIVSDKGDAILLASKLDLMKVEYCDNEVCIELQTKFLKKIGRPKRTVFISGQSKGMTMSQYNKHIKLDTLSKTEIIKRGILTKTKLNNAISSGSLNVIKTGVSEHISQKELREFLN